MKKQLQDYTAEEIAKFDEIQGQLNEYNAKLQKKEKAELPQIPEEDRFVNQRYRSLILAKELGL